MTSGARPRVAAPLRTPLTGTLRVPGDKSITHRALLLAGLADGESEVRGANPGQDCRATATAAERIGARFDSLTPEDAATTRVDWRVRGAGSSIAAPEGVLDCGNSGTTMRLLAGALAAVPGEFVLDGDESLRRRPMRRVVEPLRRMGAQIEGPDDAARCPLTIRGGGLRAIEHEPAVASAQVKSCVLLAGLGAAGTTWVREPRPSRDHTERMLPRFGIPVRRREDGAVGVDGPQRPRATTIDVPGDFSAAAFWLVAATLVPGSTLTVPGVGLNPGRTGLIEVLQRMGASLTIHRLDADTPGETEPAGSVTAHAAPLRATDIGPEEIPALIDEVPVWVLAAACAQGVSRLRGAAELRVKESDRLHGLARGFAALGVRVTEHHDGLDVEGRGGGGAFPLAGGAVDAAGDHRLAMTFAIAGWLASAPVEVRGATMVDTSYPGFYSAFVALSSCR